jgi:hypothetical protein
MNAQDSGDLLFAVFAVAVLGLFAWRIFQGLRNPPQDLTRIRQEFEQDGQTVVRMTRMGTEWFVRGDPWRKYDVEVRGADGVLQTRTIGLEPGWISDALIWAYDPSTQRPLAWRRSTF